jgi:hypothetical protein
MKNERIITHFQSYTTAQGCVKDLSSYFSGRITVASQDGGVSNHRDTHDLSENGDAVRHAETSDLLDDAAEIGGVAIGTISQLFPGFGPVLTGGPAAGAMVGDVFGDYLEARQHLQSDEEDLPRQNPNLPRYDRGVVPQHVVAVDVNNEEEARLATDIMQRHGGLVTRSGTTALNDNAEDKG